MPRCKAPKIPVGAIHELPLHVTPQQACPVLDTGKDEGNAADGRFSAAFYGLGFMYCGVRATFMNITGLLTTLKYSGQ